MLLYYPDKENLEVGFAHTNAVANAIKIQRRYYPMTNAILKTVLETGINTNLNVSSDEIVQANVNTCGVLMVDEYRLKRMCTKTDRQLIAIMKAHLEE